MEYEKIAVIGAGEMGHGIAQVFAHNGFTVCLEDAYPLALEKAKARIESNLKKMIEKGRISEDSARSALKNLSYTSDMGEALKEVQLVIEAVPEKLEIKKSVLEAADKLAPATSVFASNTSNIRITTLAGFTKRPQQFFGMHFFNPPTAMKLVEVIPSQLTSDWVLADAKDLAKRIGKVPVILKKDSPGFVVNRINAIGMLLLCMIIDKELAKPEEVDAYIKSQGMPMGAYELLDFVGVDIAYDSLNYLSKELSPEYSKCNVFGRLVESGTLGRKTGRGFYDWSSGRAAIPNARPTTAVSMFDLFSLEINETVKLIEEGVSTPEDIENAVKLGMNRPFGPVSIAKSLTSVEIRKKLEDLAAKFDCSLFLPAQSIVQGKLREIIEGKWQENRLNEASANPAPQDIVYTERVSSRVLRLVINRPRLNLINLEVLEKISGILDKIRDEREIGIVVVTGAGDVFSAGAELSQYFGNSVDFMEFSQRGQGVFKKLAELPKLTIAIMKGFTLGGGLELALSCDLRVATEDVVVGFPEVTLGLVPGWGGTQRLSRLVGVSRASQLILTGERITGLDAYTLGIVNKLVSSQNPDEYGLKYAEELGTKVAPVSVGLAKQLLSKGFESPLDVGLNMEALSMGVVFGTEDLKEGISAFLQKRQPSFKGR
jgi:enoyl-CoA hydratase/3-hydroxyacyl-CoA dehydrogenase